MRPLTLDLLAAQYARVLAGVGSAASFGKAVKRKKLTAHEMYQVSALAQASYSTEASDLCYDDVTKGGSRLPQVY